MCDRSVWARRRRQDSTSVEVLRDRTNSLSLVSLRHLHYSARFNGVTFCDSFDAANFVDATSVNSPESSFQTMGVTTVRDGAIAIDKILNQLCTCFTPWLLV